MHIQSNVTNGHYQKYELRKKTYFIDVDGTLLMKPGSPSQQWSTICAAVPGMVAWVNGLEKDGHKIILVTARKESHREITVQNLLECGYCWDLLIMGCTNGERIVVNDGPCGYVEVLTNDGLG